MSDRNRVDQDRHDRADGWRRNDEDRHSDSNADQSRTSNADDRGGQGGRPPERHASGRTNSPDRSNASFDGGGYGGQGGYGSQHGQGGYASPAQGSRYGQTGADWGRSGYGSFGGDRGDDRGGGRYGGGEGSGFGYPSYAAERDSHEHRAESAERDYGLGDRNPGDRSRSDRGFGDRDGSARWGGQRAYGEGGYGAAPNPGRERLGYGEGGQAPRSDLAYDPRAGATHAPDRSSAPARDEDHEPHYRRWRDQQLDSHDRDYDRWRSAQSKRYDDEYGRYRDQRHDTFSRDFGDWRDKNRQDDGLTGPADGKIPGGAADAGGFGTASAGSTAASPAPTGATGGLTAADDSLRNVTDGGSGHRDHDKHEDVQKTQDKPTA